MIKITFIFTGRGGGCEYQCNFVFHNSTTFKEMGIAKNISDNCQKIKGGRAVSLGGSGDEIFVKAIRDYLGLSSPHKSYEESLFQGVKFGGVAPESSDAEGGGDGNDNQS